MYTHLVRTLNLEMLGLTITDPYHYYDDLIPNRVIPPVMTVSEIMEEIDRGSDPYLPDFGIRGTLRNIYKGVKWHFQLHPGGKDILYVTGMPKGVPLKTFPKFRVDQPEYQYYWEDNHIGYLTQVVPWSRVNNFYFNTNFYHDNITVR